MKRKLITIPAIICCFSTLILPVHAQNTIDTAETIQQDREYSYTYFTKVDDGDGGWDYDKDHYYSFTPSSTDEYTVEVKGDWQDENNGIEIHTTSGMSVDYGYYNPYLKRTTATAKLNSGKTYIIEVHAGGESDVPQVLSTSVKKLYSK